ncbi:YkvA family protein [Leptolyngbya sp. PCC 6406]|uniref:YkvA family protein n=1 Tax=Leptolyngbya sp. PCC 6406 TaxID=1173264 RepID=UPI0002AD18FB|nr:YkvA family protein [Leptolyngbya sp. PCC 6406]
MLNAIWHRLHRTLLGHPVGRWVVILAALVYLISPVDLVPDVIPIVGWIDDGVLATVMAAGITETVLERRREVKARKAAQKDGTRDDSRA